MADELFKIEQENNQCENNNQMFGNEKYELN
jgi:hypothetical protein